MLGDGRGALPPWLRAGVWRGFQVSKSPCTGRAERREHLSEPIIRDLIAFC